MKKKRRIRSETGKVCVLAAGGGGGGGGRRGERNSGTYDFCIFTRFSEEGDEERKDKGWGRSVTINFWSTWLYLHGLWN